MVLSLAAKDYSDQMLGNLTQSMFAENVSSAFHVRNQDGLPVSLELVECRAGAARADYEIFSLMFKGPRDTVLPQRIHEVEHPVLGTFPLFLVPVRQDHDGTYYESVFNRPSPGKNESQ